MVGPLESPYSIANYLKTDSKAMVTRILDTLIGNAVNHSKIVATEIIDDILKGAVKTDNNSTKRKHSVTDKTFVTCLTWKEKFPWLCKVEKNGIPYLQCTECISAASKGIKIGSVYSYNNFQQIVVRIAVNLILTTNNITDWIMRNE
jgi:flavoprotein